MVDVDNALDVAGSIMNIRSRATDTLGRRNGKTLLVRSEGNASLMQKTGLKRPSRASPKSGVFEPLPHLVHRRPAGATLKLNTA